ncbi:hypothetical protein [Candidatus Parabeggiatoa sp. HSG14]|uniref:hypothetical protein n=1 Tax=Candidatus Parabeggiatoa sp. HSG14 TaxID=3055593 RepID=UPI0025A6983F|nr:hypothetical protein [Thiotrichales bacterium HSG14]
MQEHQKIRNTVMSGEIVKNDEDIQIKISQEKFARIILDFLGKKQTLSYQIETAFLLDISNIAQFHYLLSEKIEKEQDTFLSLFNITIQYDDNTKRQFGDIKNVNSFYEVRDVVATDVTLHWEIVVEFPKKKIENQKIELSFSVKNQKSYGTIDLNIEHTNQAWGIEVLNHFKSYLKSIETPQYPVVNWAIKTKTILNFKFLSKLMMLIVFIGVMFASLVFSFFESQGKGLSTTISSDRQEQILKLYAFNEHNLTQQIKIALFALENFHVEFIQLTSDNLITDEKIKFILSNVVKNTAKKKNILLLWLSSITIFFLSVFGILILAVFYLKRLIKFHEKRSFIILSSRSERIFNEYKSSKGKVEFFSFSLLFFSIMCGIIANIIYQFLF